MGRITRNDGCRSHYVLSHKEIDQNGQEIAPKIRRLDCIYDLEEIDLGDGRNKKPT